MDVMKNKEVREEGVDRGGRGYGDRGCGIGARGCGIGGRGGGEGVEGAGRGANEGGGLERLEGEIAFLLENS